MKGKKILAILLAVALCAGGVVAAVVMVKRSSERTVTVMPVSEFNNRGGYGMSGSLEGIVTADATQDIYLYDTQKVEEVLVSEGDSVREGDVLMVFDTEQTSRNLEMEKLNRESLQLRYDVAIKNKETLATMLPTSGESDPYFPSIDPDEPEVEPGQPENVEALQRLNASSAPWNAAYGNDENPLGTETNPYCFLCSDGAVIEASFVNMLCDLAASGEPSCFRLEVREGDAIDGALRRAWQQDASTLAPVADDWTGRVDLAGESPFPGGDPAEQIQKLNEDILALQKQLGDEQQAAERDREEAQRRIEELEKEIEELKKKIEELTAGITTALYTDGIPVAEFAVIRGQGGEAVLTDQSSGLIPSTATYSAEELAEAKKMVQQQIDSLALDLRESELKIRETERTVGQGEVRATMNGVVKKAGDPERPPTDGSPFLQVSGADGMYVRGAVSEIYLDSISPGDVVMVTSWMSGAMHEATIKEVSPYPDTSGMFGWGDSSVSYYPFTALISGAANDYTNGEWVEISAEGAESMLMDDGRLFLWKAMIRDDSEGKYVYVRDENERLKKQYIETGEISGAGYEIRAGLSADDWIAFPYGKEVKDGAKTREGSSSELYEG